MTIAEALVATAAILLLVAAATGFYASRPVSGTPPIVGRIAIVAVVGGVLSLLAAVWVHALA